MEITENKTAESIQQLFKSSDCVRIPAYQRAYSWGDKQCSQFLEDLLEQKGKKYYLGQFLFEKDGNTLFIIDGQQRLTTTILFLSAIAKIKILKGENVEIIREIYLTDVFKTIDDDQVIFKKVTQKHLVSAIDDTETISQKRIIEAFGWQYGEEMMEQPNNTLTPEVEFEMLLNGQYVQPNPMENLTEHLAEHYLQLNSQTLSNNIERGRSNPEVIELLKRHILETTNLLTQIAQNPDIIVQEKLKSKVTSKAYDKKDFQYEKENIIPLPTSQVEEVPNANF